MLERANNQGLYHTYYYNYAFLLSRKEKYSESLVYYEKAYGAAVNSGILFDQIDARYKMGLMNYYLKNFETASLLLKDALKKAEEIKSSLLVGNTSLKVNFAFYGLEKRYDEKLEIASYRIV